MKKYQVILMLLLAVVLNFSCQNNSTVNKLDNGISVDYGKSQRNVLVYADNVIRCVYKIDKTTTLPESLCVNEKPEKVDWKLSKESGKAIITTAKLKVEVDLLNGNIQYYNADGEKILTENGRVFADHLVADKSYTNAQQKFTLTDDEKLFGLGQHKTGKLDYRGSEMLLEQANTEIAVPFLISSKGYGILWDNYSEIKFHDDADGMYLQSYIADAIDYYFVYGPEFDDVIVSNHALTGKAPMFGKWAYGFWQCKNRYSSESQIVSVFQKYRDLKIPIDNIVLDYFYWGNNGSGSFLMQQDSFPDPARMIKKVHDMNGHFMVTLWPSFSKAATVNYNVMKKANYLLDIDDYAGEIYDAYNPDARKKYWELINKNLFSIGVDAWWMDATEPENRPDFCTANTHWGLGAKYLNTFPLMTTTGIYTNQRATTETQRVFILTRSAFSGQQRNGASAWSGDIGVDFATLKKQIPSGLNFCMSGIPYWTTDIGGYDGGDPKSPAYQEVYVRWFQYGVFCPIFRTHGFRSENELWSYGKDNQKILTNYINLRYRLMPYIYSQAWKVTNQGTTMMRALPFDFRNDEKVYGITDQFMFGNAFLVNPVTEPFYFKYKEGLEKTAAPKFLTKEGETGLTFEYFNGKNFEEFVGSKTRDTLYLHALGSPYKGVARDGFSVRISGVMIPSKTGTYQAKVDGDDGVRLYIDGKLIIDEWKADDSFHANYTTIKLEAGKKYEIKHEFFDNISGAFTRFAFTNLDGTQAEVEAVKNVDKSRSVYLPGNTKWFDFWTGKTFEGGQTITAAAPIETMPLFVKAGSIVPMGPVVQYATEKTDAPVVIRVYPGADGEFTLYDDENDNYNYEKGQFSTINLKWMDEEKILTIGKREGTFNGMETTRNFNIVIVSELKGKGIEPENMPDMTVEYKGDALIIPIK